MGKRTNFICTIIFIFSILLISGCGNQNTANKIVESLEEKDYFTAGQIYDEAVQDLSDEKKESLDEAVSNAVIELLEKRYKEAESDNSLEVPFYNSLEEIEEIAISDEALNNKIESFRQERVEQEEEVDEVEEVSIQENGTAYQEHLVKDFEMDMENFNVLLNKNQESLNPIISAMLSDEKSDIGEESFSLVLTNLNETRLYIKNMQDYSQIEQYKETHKHFIEGSAYLIGADAHFNSFYESNYNNKELFFMGLDSYNKAIEEFTKVGSMYAQEKQQQ